MSEPFITTGTSRAQRAALASRRTLPLLGLALLLAVTTLPVQGSSSQQGKAERVGDARAALDRWVETRRIISQEKRDWDLGREMLEERIEVVQREIDSLRERIRQAEESIGEADRKLAGLVEQNQALRDAAGSLQETVGAMEQRTRELLPRLPDPIRERVKPISQRIPDGSSEKRQSLSERFQNVVGVVNEVNKFQREITVTSEVRSFPDGTSAQVTALYVGLGAGYYTNASATTGGLASPAPEGWTWVSMDEAAPRIAEAIAISRNEQVARFVRVPLLLR